MKHMLSFNNFLINESVSGGPRIVYHTSMHGEIKELKNVPMWFTTEPEISDVYHNFNRDNVTYEVRLKPGKYLSFEEAKSYAVKLELDWNEFQTSLVTRVENDVSNLEGVVKFKEICDGFFHLDFDPRNFNESVISLLILNPVEKIKSMRRIK